MQLLYFCRKYASSLTLRAPRGFHYLNHFFVVCFDQHNHLLLSVFDLNTTSLSSSASSYPACPLSIMICIFNFTNVRSESYKYNLVIGLHHPQRRSRWPSIRYANPICRYPRTTHQHYRSCSISILP